MVAHQPATEAVDHVPRLKAWLEAHPGYTIEVRNHMWMCLDGTAQRRPDELAVVAYDLGILLDRLDAK
jgi:hypothetical protein